MENKTTNIEIVAKSKTKLKIEKSDLILIMINTLVYIVWIFFYNDFNSVISFVSYILYMVSLFLASIGKWEAHLFSIFSYVFYLYICISLFYVGEIVSTLIIIVISMVFILSWRKNQVEDQSGKKKLKVNIISSKEFIISNLATLAIFAVCFFVFKAINSNEILLNAIITAVTFISYYYTYRVSKLSFLYGFISIALYMTLWLKTLASGSDFASIYVIGSVFSIIWSVKSLINWSKMEKLAQKEK